MEAASPLRLMRNPEAQGLSRAGGGAKRPRL